MRDKALRENQKVAPHGGPLVRTSIRRIAFCIEEPAHEVIGRQTKIMCRASAHSSVLIIALFACVALSSITRAQEVSRPTDLSIEGLIGSVKRVDEETSRLVTRNGVTREVNRRRTRSVVFDEKGRVTYKWVAIDDLPPFRHQYFYDKSGNRIGRTWHQGYSSRDMSPMTSLSTFQFDSSRRILTVDEYRGERIDPKMLRQVYEYYFDENGRIVADVMKDFRRREIFRTDFTYDSQFIINGALHSMVRNPVGQIFSYENTSDEQGNWIRRRSYMKILKSGEERTEIIYRKISYRD